MYLLYLSNCAKFNAATFAFKPENWTVDKHISLCACFYNQVNYKVKIQWPSSHSNSEYFRHL